MGAIRTYGRNVGGATVWVVCRSGDRDVFTVGSPVVLDGDLANVRDHFPYVGSVDVDGEQRLQFTIDLVPHKRHGPTIGRHVGVAVAFLGERVRRQAATVGAVGAHDEDPLRIAIAFVDQVATVRGERRLVLDPGSRDVTDV